MVAVFTGTSFGPLMGGFMADSVGYKAAFFITGGLLFSGGFIVSSLLRRNLSALPRDSVPH
jgi:MFS family permease